MEKHYKFWMVASEKPSAIMARHETIESAEAECIRLVQKEGRPFYIMEAVKICVPEKAPVKWLETVEAEH